MDVGTASKDTPQAPLKQPHTGRGCLGALGNRAVERMGAPLGGIELRAPPTGVLRPTAVPRSGGAELMQFRRHSPHVSIAASLGVISRIWLVQKLH
jgi:hypothetical protein